MKNITQKYIAKIIANIPDDLKDELENDLKEIVKYEKLSVLIRSICQESANLLEYGLPKSCPGFIDFKQIEKTIQENYAIIGSNGFGDQIVLNLKNGNLESINHDLNNKIEYINKSILCFMNMVYRYDNADSLYEYAKKNDPNSIIQGRHWHVTMIGKTKEG